MSFKKWVDNIFWWRKVSHLEKLVDKQHEIIKELGERSKETGIPIKKHEETIENFNKEISDIRTSLEKEKEKASVFERELSKVQNINTEFKGEVERKNTLIREYEESVKTLKDKFEEVSNRYQEAIEKFEKEKQTAISLEMLILDLDKELGLMDAVKQIEGEEKLPEITIEN